jgi:iron complex outermembrane receptor protein
MGHASVLCLVQQKSLGVIRSEATALQKCQPVSHASQQSLLCVLEMFRLLARGDDYYPHPQVKVVTLTTERYSSQENSVLNKSILVRSLALAFGGASLAMSATQDVQAQTATNAQQLERITVTGSNIRRTDTETIAPVEVITRAEIERSGKVTLAEVLTTIPSNTGGSFNETANSFAPGSSGASLRGLGQKATLVLINGRRVAGYGFAQNIQDSFVDLNSIPASAVERVEILKDGASAIYGSDAIAGVINVILRKDFQGVEVAAGAGHSKPVNDYRASIAAGFGDLASDRYNVSGVLDFYKRDEARMSDTEFAPSRDLRGKYAGGRNFQSLTAGGTWTSGNFRRANADCKNVLTFDDAVNAGLLTPNQAALPLNGTAAGNVHQTGNTWCARDFSNSFTVIPENQRVGFIGRGTFDLTSTVQAYAELGLSHNETKFHFQEPFFAGTTGLYPVNAAGDLAIFPFNITFAPSSAGNPFGTNATYSGVLNDLGTRDSKIISDSFRVLAGAKYALGKWDLDSAVNLSRSDAKQDSRILTKQGTADAFGITTAPQPPQPVSTASLYNLNQPSLNSQALRDSMMANNPRSSKSDLVALDTKATTEIFDLPAGAVGLAVGAEFRHEQIKDRPSTLASTGGVLGQGATNVDGSRNSYATFAELAVPLTATIESQLALRDDHYSDFGNALTPKLGLKFKPVPEFLVRANWGRGFRAPSLPEITKSSAFFFTAIAQPAGPNAGNFTQIAGSISANPNLKPEKSRNWDLGFVFAPTKDMSVGVDLFEVKWANQVVFQDFQAIADDPTDPRAIRAADGSVLAVNGNYENATEILMRGIDIDASYAFRTSIGKFTAKFNGSYVDTYQYVDAGGDRHDFAGSNEAWDYLNTSAIPRWKAVVSLDWDQGPWSATAKVNYIAGYRRSEGLSSANLRFFTGPNANTIPQTGLLPFKAPPFTTFDLFGSYQVTSKFTLNASVLNLTNRLPPFDPVFSTTYFYDRFTYDVRGRIVRVGASYKFL